MRNKDRDLQENEGVVNLSKQPLAAVNKISIGSTGDSDTDFWIEIPLN